MAASKTPFSGTVVVVQPRIRLTRSFDERSHTYQGYTLGIDGKLDGEPGSYLIGIGKAAQAKHEFRVGDEVSGECEPVADPRTETAGYYKTSKLKLVERAAEADNMPPPWIEVPPALEVYRGRGHRRLDTGTFRRKCATCIWGCEMPVEMIIDQWNPTNVRWRRETFCYGPKSCKMYRAGPTRKVPGRKGMTWVEEDWIDEQETSHRGQDE